MTDSPVDLPADSNPLEGAVRQVGRVLLGKAHAVRLAVTCLVARGHLLIEDLPGLGKTTLAQALAQVTGLAYRRVQFTSDMLPADLTGFAMFDKAAGRFEFQRGPLFCQFLLADEINRCSPKTQSALLEAMEERQVSVDGVSHALPVPFFVIATQNPHSLAGTFPLPESQLDRFLLRISLGYPDAGAERDLLAGSNPRARLAEIEPALDAASLLALQARAEQVRASAAVLDYVQRLLRATREGGDFVHGISPRGGLALLQAARAWALLGGRDYLSPDDVQAVAAPVFSHRLCHRSSGAQAGVDALQQWVESIDVLAD
ncbi:MAG: MoxR family ATPase [Cellvibrionales bacterium]|nr:MoxR family ATPase [Cellvibrionales bacterium]